MFLLTFVLCIFFSTALALSTGTVRLYRNGIADTSQSWSSGIVQIYYSSSWGNICDDSYFGSDEADVICHQLGYSGASSYSNTGTTTTWGTDYSSTKFDEVSCLLSSYLTITQCSFSTYISSYSCSNTDDVVVTCYSTRIWSSPSAGDIRLSGGTYSNQGLLEVYCNDQWGTVCDDYFYSTQAQVACRQLGYNDYTNYDHLSLTGDSSQDIFLRSLSGCSSTYDDCLTECGGCPSSGISGCGHYEDVTLQCEYDSSYSKVSTTTNNYCDFSDYSVSTGLIVGVVVASIIGCIVCLALIIGVPICICVCLGIGIGAAASSGTRSRVVTTQPVTAPAVVTVGAEAVNTPQQYIPVDANFRKAGQPPPAPGGYPQQPAY